MNGARPLENRVINAIETTWPKLNLKGLSQKEKRFCMLFCGNPVEAAKQAGYSDTNPAYLKRTAWNLMNRKQIKENCRILQKSMDGVMIAHSEEVLAFFTESMRDESLNQSERLSAAKLLAQYRGLLSERLIIDQHTTSHEVKEYTFAGPKSNFLKSLEDATHEAIDITPEPVSISELDYII